MDFNYYCSAQGLERPEQCHAVLILFIFLPTSCASLQRDKNICNLHHNIKFALATELVLITFYNNGTYNKANALQNSLPCSSRVWRQDLDLPRRHNRGSEILKINLIFISLVFLPNISVKNKITVLGIFNIQLTFILVLEILNTSSD